jgi:hypothetical protein
LVTYTLTIHLPDLSLRQGLQAIRRSGANNGSGRSGSHDGGSDCHDGGSGGSNGPGYESGNPGGSGGQGRVSSRSSGRGSGELGCRPLQPGLQQIREQILKVQQTIQRNRDAKSAPDYCSQNPVAAGSSARCADYNRGFGLRGTSRPYKESTRLLQQKSSRCRIKRAICCAGGRRPRSRRQRRFHRHRRKLRTKSSRHRRHRGRRRLRTVPLLHVQEVLAACSRGGGQPPPLTPPPPPTTTLAGMLSSPSPPFRRLGSTLRLGQVRLRRCRR